jgi:hypothetical protein
VIHHSLTKDGRTVSWGAIRKYHMTEMAPPMVEIGYHEGVELVDDAYEALMGRPWDRIGAHTLGQNYRSLGLCLIGNFDLEEPPPKQLEKAAGIVALWLRLFGIDKTKIYPHGFFNPKTCPGLKFDMIGFINLVSQF